MLLFKLHPATSMTQCAHRNKPLLHQHQHCCTWQCFYGTLALKKGHGPVLSMPWTQLQAMLLAPPCWAGSLCTQHLATLLSRRQKMWSMPAACLSKLCRKGQSMWRYGCLASNCVHCHQYPVGCIVTFYKVSVFPVDVTQVSCLVYHTI